MKSLTDVIIHCLMRAGRALRTSELLDLASKELGRSINEYELLQALLELIRKGIVRRIYPPDYDPSRPFDTAAWELSATYIQEIRQEILHSTTAPQSSFTLVVSVPLVLRNAVLQHVASLGAIEFMDAYAMVLGLAETELRIACPFIDSVGVATIYNALQRKAGLKVMILTEFDNRVTCESLAPLLKMFTDRIEVRSLLQKLGTTKTCGIHAKMIIADDKIALVGSFNLVTNSYLKNVDVGYLITDAKAIQALRALFDVLWSFATEIR